MKENIYGAAYVKCLEKNMFTMHETVKLAKGGASELYSALSEHGYIGESVAEMISREEKRTFELCLALCKNERFRRIISAKELFSKIKKAVKTEICKNVFIRERISEDEFFEEEIFKSAYAEYEKSGDLRAVDEYIDKVMHDYIIKNAARNQFLSGWAELYLDNLHKKTEALRRADNFGEDANLRMFFKDCDDALMQYLKNAHFLFFDDAAIFAYFFGKITECKNMRLIAVCKNKETAREELREAYV